MPTRFKSQLRGPSKILHLHIMRPPLIKNKVPIMFLIQFCIGWAIKPTFTILGPSNPLRPFPHHLNTEFETSWVWPKVPWFSIVVLFSSKSDWILKPFGILGLVWYGVWDAMTANQKTLVIVDNIHTIFFCKWTDCRNFCFACHAPYQTYPRWLSVAQTVSGSLDIWLRKEPHY